MTTVGYREAGDVACTAAYARGQWPGTPLVLFGPARLRFQASDLLLQAGAPEMEHAEHPQRRVPPAADHGGIAQYIFAFNRPLRGILEG